MDSIELIMAGRYTYIFCTLIGVLLSYRSGAVASKLLKMVFYWQAILQRFFSGVGGLGGGGEGRTLAG